jgi:carbon monoxide dehydrogenase subunit G
MQLDNDFVVDVPIEEVWDLLLDLGRVIPCMPGAALLGRDGDDVRGSLQIKVGPIGANFTGTARFLEVDPDARTAAILASGNDPKGRTTAKANINVRLVPSEKQTQVYVETELTLTGKLAQFGRGAIMDISTKMIGQFTDNLQAEMLRSQSGSSSAGSGPVGAVPGPSADGQALGAKDLATLMGPVLVKQVGAPLLVIALLCLVWRRRRA